MQEFKIINHYFKHFNQTTDPNIQLGIGDDCAILNTTNINQLLITSDTLVLGTHFLDSAPAHSIGHKCLAVNLSDVAAMGGIPKWFTLALTLPKIDHEWLSEFTRGLSDLAKQFNVSLIGGDLTSGPLSITITLFGLKSNKILTRQSAKAGDGIFVSGSLGLPSYLLQKILENNIADTQLINSTENKLYYPQPRVQTGIEIAPYAHAAIDISDGLLADLQHITGQSGVTAELYLSEIPICQQLKEIQAQGQLDATLLNQYILAGGDEYELLFTAPLEHKDFFLNNDKHNNISYIGKIKQGDEPVTVIDEHNNAHPAESWIAQSWQHFE